jgi:hypothetical protein
MAEIWNGEQGLGIAFAIASPKAFMRRLSAPDPARRLNQIPDDWHQIAVRFRRANSIRDGDKERSIW